MKVLLLSQFYPPIIGGEERHVRTLAMELTRRGHDVSVGTLVVPGTTEGTTVEDGVTIHRLRSLTSRLAGLYAEQSRPHLPPLPDPVLSRGLAALVKRLDPEVVHAHNWILNSYLPVAVRRHTPVVLTLHDYSDRCSTKRFVYAGTLCSGPAPRKCLGCASEHYGPLKGAVTALGVAAALPVRRRKVSQYLTVSAAVATGNGLEEAGVPYEVVPNFVPDGLEGPVRERPDFAPAGPYLFFAGDLTREKGLHTLLAAYESLGPDAPALLVAGRRAPDTPATLPAGVTLVEDLKHEQVLAAFAHALAAALPSVWPDPCPTTVLEAMALGAPVVTTTTGGMVDMVEDGVSGLLVEPGNAPALAAALQTLIADATLRDRFRLAAKERVGARFSVGSVADKIEAVYTRVTR
jgi:glycosyltransferase involved in cell wall biosynthesis